MFSFDGSQINWLIAYVAGFVTFFASCLLPLVPTYLAYLSGVSLTSNSASTQKWKIVRIAASFVAGFILTFIILGLALNQFANFVAPYRVLIEKLSGILFIMLGLFMLGVFKSQFFAQERKIDIHKLFWKHQHIHSFLTGIAFGFGWTPCIGPVLAVILYWASQAESAVNGILLLTMYGLGLGTPFILVAVGFEKIIPLLKKYKKVSHYATMLSGTIVILAGIFLLLGQFQAISHFILELFQLNKLSI